MKHAAHTVGPLRRKLRIAQIVAIELRTPLDQLARVAGALVAQDADGAFVAQAVARGDGVGCVELGRIIGADCSGNAPLCVLGVAFARIGFRDDDDVANARELNRSAEAGDTAANDYEVAA
jgi:hypothetical protein